MTALKQNFEMFLFVGYSQDSNDSRERSPSPSKSRRASFQKRSKYFNQQPSKKDISPCIIIKLYENWGILN